MRPDRIQVLGPLSRVSAAVALVLLLAAAFPGRFSGIASAGTSVRIGGTGGGLGTMRVLGEAFRKSGAGNHVTILPSLGTSGGIRALLEGAIDIAVVARPLTEEEKRKGLADRVYGRTAIVFIAHEGQPATGFTRKQIAEIYEGKVERWPDGTPVRLIMRPEESSETKSLMAFSPEMDRASRVALARKGMVYALNDQEAAEKVEKIPGSITPLPLAQILAEKRRVRVLSLDGVVPSVKTTADGSYPLVRDAWIVTGPSVTPAAKRFLRFLRSPAGQKLLVQFGLVPQD